MNVLGDLRFDRIEMFELEFADVSKSGMKTRSCIQASETFIDSHGSRRKRKDCQASQRKKHQGWCEGDLLCLSEAHHNKVPHGETKETRPILVHNEKPIPRA